MNAHDREVGNAAVFTATSPQPDSVGPVVAGPYKSPAVDWSLLVKLVQAGESQGLDDLYRLFARGIRFHLCRQLGPHELDDKVHDTFLLVVHAIQKGDLRDPERLMGFVRTIVRRQVTLYIGQNVQQRRDQHPLEPCTRLRDIGGNPEEHILSGEARTVVRQVLDRMNQRDREILTRFYLHEQTPQEICDEMDLTNTQFRLLKSRAKARFGEMGKKKLQQGALTSLFVRTSAAPSH